MATQEWLDGILESILTIFHGAPNDQGTKDEVVSIRKDLTDAITQLRDNDLSDASAKQEAKETADRLQAAMDALVKQLAAAPESTPPA